MNHTLSKGRDWPDNLWLGISAENQNNLDLLAALLKEAVRPGRLILSAEPLLGPLDLTPWLGLFRWVIVEGLSGPWLPFPAPTTQLRPPEMTGQLAKQRQAELF